MAGGAGGVRGVLQVIACMALHGGSWAESAFWPTSCKNSSTEAAAPRTLRETPVAGLFHNLLVINRGLCGYLTRSHDDVILGHRFESDLASRGTGSPVYPNASITAVPRQSLQKPLEVTGLCAALRMRLNLLISGGTVMLQSTYL